MRILVIRPWGRTSFELGGYCRDALIEIGHTAGLFTYNDERISSRIPFLRNAERRFIEKIFLKKISDFQPRLILVIKGDRIPGEVIKGIRKKFNIPLANYWIDDPFLIDVSRKISPYYDYFFTNDLGCVQTHRNSGCPNVNFLSFGCVPALHRKSKLSREEYKKYGSDICFAGTVSDRRYKVLEALGDFDLKIWSQRSVCHLKEKYQTEKKEIHLSSPLYHKFSNRAVWNEELVKVYNASKIVLNIHFPQPVPIMRDFEVTGCGAFLLTDYIKDLEGMFTIGEEIVCYKNEKELSDLIKFYLEHSGEREKIAQKGQQRAYQEHTYAHRMKELISFLSR